MNVTSNNSKVIQVPLSLGDFIDRLSILQIKLARLSNTDALAAVQMQETAYQSCLKAHPMAQDPVIAQALEDLTKVNTALWMVEDQLRDFERVQDFGPEFIEAARNVYRLNDKRAAVKRDLDDTCGSAFGDVKLYGTTA
ncbi:MAG: hypothetical protein ABJF50_17840 [Paracoccaceae bacterium]